MTTPAQTITDAAAAALAERTAEEARLAQQLRDTLVRLARETAARLFGDRLDVSALRVERTDMEAFVVVLTDGEVCLAVTDDGDVLLTSQVDGQWTSDGRPVTDLADLGARLGL